MKLYQYRNGKYLIRRYCVDQWSMREIAEECGVNLSTIRYWLGKHGIYNRNLSEAARIRTDRMKDGVTLEIANKTYRNKKWLEEKRIKEELTEEEIAEMCNVSHSTIGRWLRIWGFGQGRIKVGRVSEPMSFTMPGFMREKIDKYCQLKKIKRSALIRELIEERMFKEGINLYK